MAHHTRLKALLIVPAAALLLAMAPGRALAHPPPSEWVIGAHKKVVMLTLEGNSGESKLRKMLDVLDERGAKATFFISGKWIKQHMDAAREVIDRGNMLGNRGWGKKSFTKFGDGRIQSSIQKASKQIRKAGNQPGPYTRPPHGARDLRVLEAMSGRNKRSVRWSFHPGPGSSDSVKKKVMRHLEKGSIIALDATRRAHRNALKKIIKGVKNKGYKFKTVRALDNAHPIRWDVTLREGSSGDDVRYLQKRLRYSTYPAGKADGRFDYSTLEATYAFEKVNKMSRDGVVSPSQLEKLAKSGKPKVPDHAARTFVDVDVSRQVLFEVVKGKLKHTLPVSTGNEEYYTFEGERLLAHTPRGSYVIERKIAGWREGSLGRLYYPSYFTGGYAIHGSESVPTYPASHGCVRIPMYVATDFYYRNPIGTAVYVRD